MPSFGYGPGLMDGGAKKVTDEGLFIYSWQSGRVSGAQNHAVSDWRGWHPWVKDHQHPVASAATPANGRPSHGVRQYDEPVISVIIPVGPGHNKLLIDALDSLEAQTFRKWEVIVVFDTGNEYYPELFEAYPYIRPVFVDNAPQGAGHARNRGAEIARAPFLLFLDADDYLSPDALEQLLAGWSQNQAIIYSDYYGKAMLGDVKELAPDLRNRIIATDDTTGVSLIRYKAFEYDCARAQSQPVGDGSTPYVWCNITSLVPTAWHIEIGGFDEEMKSWEDWDYWLRMAHAGRCFVRIDEPLLTYRFYGGTRRDTGRELRQELITYLQHKYEEVEMTPCSSCSKRGSAPSAARAAPPPARAATPGITIPPAQAVDNDFVDIEYLHPNRGQHHVYGTMAFPYQIEGVNMVGAKHGGFKMYYGFRAKGDRFTVHRKDAEQNPHLFRMVISTEPPEVEHHTPDPVSIASGQTPQPKQAEPASSHTFDPSVPSGMGQGGVDDLQKLPGVTSSIAQQLYDAGVTTVEQLAKMTKPELQQIKGVGDKRAEAILSATQLRLKK